jgi:hypothetical protein
VGRECGDTRGLNDRCPGYQTGQGQSPEPERSSPACLERPRDKTPSPVFLTPCNHILSISFPRFFLPHLIAPTSSASKILLRFPRRPTLVPCQPEKPFSSCLATGPQTWSKAGRQNEAAPGLRARFFRNWLIHHSPPLQLLIYLFVLMLRKPPTFLLFHIDRLCPILYISKESRSAVSPNSAIALNLH